MSGLSDSAKALGAPDSSSAEMARPFEAEGPMTIAEAAQRLGCHQRTLLRQLHPEGTRAEPIRMAARILRAQQRPMAGHA